MSGRFVYWMNVSVDPKIEYDAGEEGGSNWMRIGVSLHREFNARASALSLGIEGRTIYESWRTSGQAARLLARVRRDLDLDAQGPRLQQPRNRSTQHPGHRRDDAIAQLAALRAEIDGDIGVGGATLATNLLRAHLLDELMLFTHLVVTARGRPLLDPYDEPVELDLLEHRSFDDESRCTDTRSVAHAPQADRPEVPHRSRTDFQLPFLANRAR